MAGGGGPWRGCGISAVQISSMPSAPPSPRTCRYLRSNRTLQQACLPATPPRACSAGPGACGGRTAAVRVRRGALNPDDLPGWGEARETGGCSSRKLEYKGEMQRHGQEPGGVTSPTVSRWAAMQYNKRREYRAMVQQWEMK